MLKKVVALSDYLAENRFFHILV